jgi:hypothetical protein
MEQIQMALKSAQHTLEAAHEALGRPSTTVMLSGGIAALVTVNYIRSTFFRPKDVRSKRALLLMPPSSLPLFSSSLPLFFVPVFGNIVGSSPECCRRCLQPFSHKALPLEKGGSPARQIVCPPLAFSSFWCPAHSLVPWPSQG